jgi:hypothetical protein
MVINPKIFSRRELIRYYVEYDVKKKNILSPVDIDEWDWNDPNAIDEKLRSNGFKYGVVSGFKQWHLVQLSRRDLLWCAIVDHIFPGESQVLDCLVSLSAFKNWRPDRPTEWYERLEAELPFPLEWAIILRPTVPNEYPAKWYIEDGSGRAICFLRRLIRQQDNENFAYGYLGDEPDDKSEFMKQHFRELLNC